MDGLNILIIEDDKRLLEELTEYLKSKGHEVSAAEKPSYALSMAETASFDIALIDLKLPEYDGIECLKRLKAMIPDIEAIIMSGHGDMESVIEALRFGAFDFLRKPFSPMEIQFTISRTRKYLESQRETQRLKEIIRLAKNSQSPEALWVTGASKKSKEMTEIIEQASQAPNSPVLITGESGVGKELVARLIHTRSPRSEYPFQAVNCAAIPRELFESEFFGHEKGAYTDAKKARLGFFRSAHKGTLFLDEIGDLPLDQQTKLLRMVEEGAVRPLGSDTTVPVDVRIICATNKDIMKAVDEKQFRSDFYYRIAVVEITVPALRERREDIPALATFFAEELAGKMGRKPVELGDIFIRHLLEYSFPGNIRELRNLVERALILGQERIIKEDLNGPGAERTAPPELPLLQERLHLGEMESRLIERALRKTEGNLSAASRLLGISRQALNRKLAKYPRISV